MARHHRMEHPETGEIVWTDTPSAYGGWIETAKANRAPRDHEDKVKGKWKIDHERRQGDERLRKLRAMPRDELVDHIADEVVRRLKAEGLVLKADAS
jgi:transposase